MTRRENPISSAVRNSAKRNNLLYRDFSFSEMKLLVGTNAPANAPNDDRPACPPANWGAVLKNVTTPVYKNLSPSLQKRALRYYPAYTGGCQLSVVNMAHAESLSPSRSAKKPADMSDLDWVRQWRTPDSSSDDDMDGCFFSPLNSPVEDYSNTTTLNGFFRCSLKAATLKRRSAELSKAVEKYSPILHRARSHGNETVAMTSLDSDASLRGFEELQRVSIIGKRNSLDLTGQ